MATKQVIDSLNRSVKVPIRPERIISLVPSISALIYELGGASRFVGRTKFCDYPPKIKKIPSIGGTKQFRLDDVRALNPDLIIANKEENTIEMISAIEMEIPVFVTEVKNWEDSLHMIETLGNLIDLETAACRLVDKLRTRCVEYMLNVENNTSGVAYLIWREPYMTIGHDTFIHSMLEIAGFKNVFAEKDRYPVITAEEIKERGAEYVFLSSEPYPFKKKHIKEIESSTGAQALLVDGALFSWYGSRMIKAFDHFREIRGIINGRTNNLSFKDLSGDDS